MMEKSAQKKSKKARWRAPIHQHYFFVKVSPDAGVMVASSKDIRISVDDQYYHNGNYFEDRTTANVYADRIRKILLASKSSLGTTPQGQ